MSRLAVESAGGEDWVQMVGNGKVSILYSCASCGAAPLRMNGWVRAKKSTRNDWFCAKCGDRWTHAAADSERWLLLWVNGMDSDDDREEGW
eukprot:237710-Amphidinium_carterae.1